MFVVPVKET